MIPCSETVKPTCIFFGEDFTGGLNWPRWTCELKCPSNFAVTSSEMLFLCSKKADVCINQEIDLLLFAIAKSAYLYLSDCQLFKTILQASLLSFFASFIGNLK